ncbi:MAG: NlpC/P60 family protein [Rhodobacteraceae bacterium]|nr:NlpC/P60 family protein [Paracoccaceae bacterium]
MSRPDVVERARSWIGTPYRHQASLRGTGADCLGLVRGVWRELKGREPAVMPAYTADWSEAEGEEALWLAARTHLREVRRAPEPGDIILFRMRDGMIAKHLGILSADGDLPRFIHAYQGHGVTESPFSAPWQRRAVSYFEFP